MSSVLKALKKLEDKDSHQPQLQTWAHIDTKKTVNRRVRWFWLFNKCVSVLILLTTVAVIAGGCFVLIRNPILVQKLFSARISGEKKAGSRPPTPATRSEMPSETSVDTAWKKGDSSSPQKESDGLTPNESLVQSQKETPSYGKRMAAEPAAFSAKKDTGPVFDQKKVAMKTPVPKESDQKRYSSSLKDSDLYQEKLAALKKERRLKRTKRESLAMEKEKRSKAKVSPVEKKRSGSDKSAISTEKRRARAEKLVIPPTDKKRADPNLYRENITSKNSETFGHMQKETPTKIKTEPSKPVHLPGREDSVPDRFEEPAPDLKAVPDPSDKINLLEKENAKLKAEKMTDKPDRQNREPSSPDKPPATFKPLNDSRFKIQALVWSNEPGSRMAVVNDQVVRAGGSVDGAVVKHIGADHIVLKEGKDEWEVKFRIK